MPKVRKMMMAAAVGMAVMAGCGQTTHTRVPATVTVTHPPGWVAQPVGTTNPANWVCFDNSCYHVDGQGHPYGQPFNQQSN